MDVQKRNTASAAIARKITTPMGSGVTFFDGSGAVMMRYSVTIMGLALLPVSVRAQACDSAFVAAVRQQTDSIRQTHLAKPYVPQYVARAATRIDSMAQRRCLTPPVVVPPDTTPPVPPDTSPVDSMVGPAHLPRLAAPMALSVLDDTVRVADARALAQLLATADAGLLVELEPGVDYGAVTLGPRADRGWVVLETAGGCPAGRVTPTTGASLATFSMASANSPAIRVTGQRWLVRCVGATVAPGIGTGSAPIYTFVEAAQGSQDVVFDRLWVRANPTTVIARGISLHGVNNTVTRSWVEEIHARGQDAQAVWMARGPGPYTIEDNTLIASGENIMSGGDGGSPPNTRPSDITIRRNHILKPAAWCGQYTVKNLIELKDAVRVLIEGNVLEGNCGHASLGQNGDAIIIKSANQGGNCPLCRSTDVVIRGNHISNVGGGIIFGGRGDNVNTDSLPRRVVFAENVIEGVNVPPFKGSGYGILLVSPGHTDLVIERNLIAGTHSFLTCAAKSGNATNVTFVDNVARKGSYGFFASGGATGNAAWTTCVSGARTWSGNTIIGTGNAASYPPGTTFVGSEAQAPRAATIRQRVSTATAGVAVRP